MSKKIWFKKQREPVDKFSRFCKEKGADYFEYGCGVWIIPKQYGDSLAGIRLEEDGTMKLGEIEEDCMNFVSSSATYYAEEIIWAGQIAANIMKKKQEKKQRRK